MTKSNSLRAANDEIREDSAIINSIENLKNFLAEQNIKKDVIERVGVSFMAKISAGTKVKLDGNMLYVGESVLNLGEDIYMKTAWTKALLEQTNYRAMQILDHNPPMIQPDRSVIATNDEVYTQAA